MVARVFCRFKFEVFGVNTCSLTSVPQGVGGQPHDPATLTPRNTRYPLYRKLGWHQGRSGRVRKILTPPGFDPPTAVRPKWEKVIGEWRRL
jgi:hypothetical protein